MMVLPEIPMFLITVSSSVIIKGGLVFIEATSMFKCVKETVGWLQLWPQLPSKTET